MADQAPTKEQVDHFILETINTVPELEALLLLWNKQPRAWQAGELAAALYISSDETQDILDALLRRALVVLSDLGEYSFRPGPHDMMIGAVEQTYRRELIRISRMIHAKAPSSVRQFARAFMFRKDRG